MPGHGRPKDAVIIAQVYNATATNAFANGHGPDGLADEERQRPPRRRGTGGSRSKGESNDQVTHPAESTEPSPDAAGSAGHRRSRGGTGGMQLVGHIIRRRWQRQHQHE